MTHTHTKFLSEGLSSQMNRVRDLITVHNKLSGSVSIIEASHMNTDIQNAEEAISACDAIQMLISFKKLKDWES